MALLEDLVKGSTPAGLVIGVGAGLLAPVLAPAVSGVLRPAAKALMRTGITAYRGTMEPISAAVRTLVTEAQLELATASSAATTAAPKRAEAPQKPRPHKRQGGVHNA